MIGLNNTFQCIAPETGDEVWKISSFRVKMCFGIVVARFTPSTKH